MAAQSPAEPPAPATIHYLSDDLLREILLCLPSLPSLVRAALTCRAFLAAVRSSPAFRRRFRALHPPPLLGFFFDNDGTETPTFIPIGRRSDPDLAAAVRGLDIFLTRVPHQWDVVFHSVIFHGFEPEEETVPEWHITQCRGGCLLLLNQRTKLLAAYNPLTGALNLVPRVADQISKEHCGEFVDARYFLVAPDDEASDRLSFRVVSLWGVDMSQVRVAIFSSATRKWQILPVSEPALTQPVSGAVPFLVYIQVNGLYLCWSHGKDAYMLNFATLQFYVIDLPPELGGQGHLYRTGDTKDGKLCIAAVIDFTLLVWVRRSDADGLDKWVLQNSTQLEREVGATKRSWSKFGNLYVYAVLDGIVYMHESFRFKKATMPCWYLSFCLETRKLEKIFHVKADGLPHPYFMPWPTSLLEMEHPAQGQREKLGDDNDGEIVTTLRAIKRLKSV